VLRRAGAHARDRRRGSPRQEDRVAGGGGGGGGANRVATVRFGAEPGVLHVDRTGDDGVAVDDRATNLAAAIEVAAAATPPFYVPKIVLLSDGNQTVGDALKAALRAGIPISTVPLPTRSDPEVQVAAVNVPAQVAQGEAFYVEVVVDTNVDNSAGEIEVYRGPHKVISEKKTLKKGENRFRFRQTIEQERLATFTARARGYQDTLLDNNSDFGLVFTSGKPRVLVVESDPKTARELAYALEEQDVQVDIRPPQGMPDSLADLQNYELLVVSNVPATALTLRQMEVARTFVQDLGGGLIMIGGDQSFGLGGYYKTVLEEILPVRSDFEKEKEKPSLAMMLVIDKSGSMGGEKIEMAKEAAKSAVELLGPSDKIGVVAFDGETFWITNDIQPCSDKASVLDHISSIEAGGGTTMYPAMEEAYDALKKTSAKLKHVIILTDGISAPGDFEGISQSMAGDRITVSTVGVGEGADQNLLESIAKIGGGRNYFVEDPNTIPQIFAKETVAASKSAINEQPFLAQVVRPTQALSEIDFASAPLLMGYVVTRPKATSEVILATEAGDPLLTWWRYGLGICVAFTSDAKSRWAAEWIPWPGFGKFWAQVVRHAMRKAEARGSVVQVEHKNRHATVSLDAIDPAGRFINGAETKLTVIDPTLGNRKLEMSQTAPGRYVAEFDTVQSGSYHLEFAQEQGGKVLNHQSRGLAVGYPDELRLRPANTGLLRSIAAVTNGQYDPSPEAVFAPTARQAQRASPLWPYLVAAAALVFVADVALRRVDLTRRREPFRRGISVPFARV
jgi:Ca-activated chloride channel family protein